MNLSPLVKYGIIAAIVVAVVFGIYHAGANSVQAKWDLAKAEVKEKIVIQKVIEEKITEKVVTKYVDRIKEVKTKGDQIVKEVKVYVTSNDDSKCVVNNGALLVLDSAVNNAIPRPANETDGEPSGVDFSDVVKNTANNYNICNQYIEQNRGLKEWAKEQKAANK